MLFKQVHDSQSNLDVQITKEGITGVFNGVLSDFGDRMSSDGISTLGTISFQQFKPTDLKASNCGLTPHGVTFPDCCFQSSSLGLLLVTAAPVTMPNAVVFFSIQATALSCPVLNGLALHLHLHCDRLHDVTALAQWVTSVSTTRGVASAWLPTVYLP